MKGSIAICRTNAGLGENMGIIKKILYIILYIVLCIIGIKILAIGGLEYFIDYLLLIFSVYIIGLALMLYIEIS